MLGINVLGASDAFTCKKTNNVFVCIPNTQDRLDSFLLLQNVIQKVAKAMAQAGRQLPFNLAEVGIDGRPGPTTTTAAKFITAVFAGKITPPPEVAALLDPNLTAEQGIQLVAANSDAIGLYLANTFRDHPEVLRDVSDKVIVLGVLDLGSSEVETPDVVAARIRRALTAVPPERLAVAPDCGMKYLPRERAFCKLEAMVAGARLVREDLVL